MVERDPEAGQTMQRATFGDAEIDYSERGAGEAIVLVHAGVFGGWFFPLSESPVLDGFRVIRVRRPGYGPKPPARHLTLADHSNTVASAAPGPRRGRRGDRGVRASASHPRVVRRVEPVRTHSRGPLLKFADGWPS